MGHEALLIEGELEAIELRALQGKRCCGLIALLACDLQQRFGLGERLFVGEAKGAVGGQLGELAQDAVDLRGLRGDAEARCQARVEPGKERLVDLGFGGTRDAAGRDEDLVAADILLVDERAGDDDGVLGLLVGGALGVDLGEERLDRRGEIADAGALVTDELGAQVDEIPAERRQGVLMPSNRMGGDPSIEVFAADSRTMGTEEKRAVSNKSRILTVRGHSRQELRGRA